MLVGGEVSATARPVKWSARAVKVADLDIIRCNLLSHQTSASARSMIDGQKDYSVPTNRIQLVRALTSDITRENLAG